MGIDAVNLGRVDLNLLVHLDALLAERSVTRAAARVGIGQSAMSHNLARLRELFDDELLTRGSDGMRLTPRAVTLLEPVRTMLAQVGALVSPRQAFDPATAVRTFRFVLPDSMEILIMPALLARMREVAPGIHLRLYNLDASRLFDDLDADEVDLAIGYDTSSRDNFTTSGASCSAKPGCACSMPRRRASRPRSRSTILCGFLTC